MKAFGKLVLTLAISATAVTGAWAGEKSVAELRAEAAALYTQADQLVEKAMRQEAEQMSEVKSRGNEVKSRGYGAHQCVMDCLPHGSLYACRRACGAY